MMYTRFQYWLLRTFFKGMVVYNVDMGEYTGYLVRAQQGDIIYNNRFDGIARATLQRWKGGKG